MDVKLCILLELSILYVMPFFCEGPFHLTIIYICVYGGERDKECSFALSCYFSV